MMSDMEKKTYITPVSDVVPLMGERLLGDDGFSESQRGVPVLDDGELDANSTSFFEEGAYSNKLWDE